MKKLLIFLLAVCGAVYAGTVDDIGIIVSNRNALFSDDFQTIVQSDSPVFYYRFDETSGTTVFDYGTYGLDLTFAGAYTLNQTTIAGSSASIDFSGGYAGAVNTLSLATTDYTLEWVFNLDVTQASFAGLASSGPSSANWAVQRYQNGNDLSVFHQGGAGRSNFVGAWALLADAADKHVVITYTNSTKTHELWINGVSQGTATNALNPSFTADQSFYVFAASLAANPAKGTLDEFALYTKKLSDTRIGYHFAATGL